MVHSKQSKLHAGSSHCRNSGLEIHVLLRENLTKLHFKQLVVSVGIGIGIGTLNICLFVY